MLVIDDSVEVNTSSDKIFDCILELENKYSQLHPNHVKARWLDNDALDLGSTLYYEEFVNGKLRKNIFRITKINPNKEIGFKHILPKSFFRSSGSYILAEIGKQTLLISRMTIRLGKLLRMISKKRIEKLKSHIKEEIENFKKIVESQPPLLN